MPTRASAAEYRPKALAPFGATPNPGAFELSLSSALIAGLAGLSLARGLAATRRGGLLSGLLGLSNAAIGVGLLVGEPKRPWLLARLGGDLADALDMARSPRSALFAWAPLACAATALYAAARLAPAAEVRARLAGKARIAQAITIGRPADELERLWFEPQTQKAIWGPFAEVSPSERGRWRWRMRKPLAPVRFETAPAAASEPGARRWRTNGGAPAGLAGELCFRPAPAGRGTEVALTFEASGADGLAERLPRRLLAPIPRAAVSGVLHRFKALAETGEAPRLQPLPSARSH